MNTIYKYQLELIGVQTVDMPKNAKVLCARVQNTILYLWAIVNTNEKKVPKIITIYGTGQPTPDLTHAKYIGTVQDGFYAWHVFEA